MDERDSIRRQNEDLRNQAVRTVEDISRERDVKGNANVTAGRYGEMVANMVRFAESELALQMLDRETPKGTAPLYQTPADQSLPSRQHVEPEALRGQNIINPT